MTVYMNVHHSIVDYIRKSAPKYSPISNQLNYGINTIEYDKAIKIMLYKYIYGARNMLNLVAFISYKILFYKSTF